MLKSMNPAFRELLAELRAIEIWDKEYWRSSQHAWSDVNAMLNRRQRRAEILGQLGRQRRAAVAKNERRLNQRVSLEADVNVHSSSGVVPGRSVDISESGMAAVLPIELDIGETANLQFKIGDNIISTRAIVKYRNVFRHGFQFMGPLEISHLCPTCGGKGFVAKALMTRLLHL